MAKKIYTPNKNKPLDNLVIDNFRVNRSKSIYKDNKKYYEFTGEVNRNKVKGLYNQRTGDIYNLKRVK